jgi:hypothetical protein
VSATHKTKLTSMKARDGPEHDKAFLLGRVSLEAV